MLPPPMNPIFLRPDQGEFFSIIGGGVRMLADSAATGGQCTILEAPIPPGEGPPLHKHTHEDEVFFILEGRFKFRLDDREFLGEAGAFNYAPRGSMHTFKNVGPATGRLYIVCMPGGIDKPFRAMKDPPTGSNHPKPGPDQVVAILEQHGITFHGPPLD